MGDLLSIPFQDKRKRSAKDLAEAWLMPALVLTIAVAVAVIGLSTTKKDFAVIGGIVAAIAVAFISGNPRLYTLWGFALTLPLSISKRFGPMYVGKPGGEDSFRLEANDLFLLVLLGFLIWDLLSEHREGLRIPKVTYLWGLLMAIGCAWIAVGPWRTTAAHEVFRMAKVMALFLVVTNELSRPKRIWHCVAGMTLAAVIQAIVALVQYRMKGLIGLEKLGETTSSTLNVLSKTSVEGVAVFRPSGLMQHANLLGVFLSVALPLVVGMLLVERRTLPRMYFLGALAVTLPAEIFAMSRSAWVTGFVGLSVLFLLMFLHPTLRPRSVITSCITGLVGLAILGALLGPITDRLLRSKDNASVAREIYKADARRMIEAAPVLGLGLNSYTFELPKYATLEIKKYGDQPPAVHNIFYLWWAETGIVGMLLFCAVWASIIWTGISNLWARDELLYVVNAACLAAMIGLIPDSFLSFTLRVNTSLRLFWLLAAVIMAVRYLRLRERHDSLRRSEEEEPSSVSALAESFS